MRSIHLVNSPLALIIFGSLNGYNVIISRTYFKGGIPIELDEAAAIDGCGQLRYFIKVVLPLSKVIILVLALFYGVEYWNDFFKALIYISDRQWYPLQLVLRGILLSTQISADMITGEEALMQMYRQQLAVSIKYGSVIVASLPVIIIYPFLQKYFAQGVMIGSVKG